MSRKTVAARLSASSNVARALSVTASRATFLPEEGFTSCREDFVVNMISYRVHLEIRQNEMSIAKSMGYESLPPGGRWQPKADG